MKKIKSIRCFAVMAIIFIVLSGVVGCSSAPKTEDSYDKKAEDIYYFILTPKSGETVSDEDIESDIENLRSRFDENGYTEATITRRDNGIRVEIPVTIRPDIVSGLIVRGKMQFRDSKGNVKVRGEHVKDARSGYDENGNLTVYLEFTSEGATLFASATKAIAAKENEVENKLFIYIDDKLVSSPTISQEISNGQATITGIDSIVDAKTIVSIIRTPLKTDFLIVEQGEGKI